jgi:hypothetical protein
MASTFASYFGLRSTIAVTTLGTPVPAGAIYVVSSNVGPVWTNTITVSSFNTLIGSSITISTLTVSTINGLLPGTGTGSVSTLASTSVSIGASTNQTYTNFSNGSFAPVSWVTAKSALSGTNKTVMSANGLYQMIVGNATSGLFLSSDSGVTWTALTGGLPTLTGNAYWSDGAISANGQYITLSIYGGSLWMSADYGRTFALTNQPTPNIWLPLNGNLTDSMGLSVVTTPGTVPGYVALNYPGYTAQAVNLVNTAGSAAAQYIRGTWSGSPSGNFTVSFWFNAQSFGGTQQALFVAYAGNYVIALNGSNQMTWYIPSGGSGLIAVTGPVVSINTWYYITAVFQTNGICSLYMNNSLIGTYTNSGGVGSYTTTAFGLGTYDTSTPSAFNGFMDDVRITNSVSAYVPIPLLQPNIWMPFENTATDIAPYSAVSSAVPTIYLPFDGTVTDSMGFSNPVVATGSVSYPIANRDGNPGPVLRLTNTAGANADQYVKGPWTGATNFTASGWFNVVSFSASNNVHLFFAYSAVFGVYIKPGTNQLIANAPNVGPGSVVGTSAAISLNTWYYIQLIFRTNGLCEFYLNNALVGSATNTGGAGTTTQFALGTLDNSTSGAFNGFIDDFRIYNSAVSYVPVSIINVTGSLSYVPGVVGLNAVNLANTAGGTANNFIRGAWSLPSNFTISFWLNQQSSSTTQPQMIFCSAGGTVAILFNPSNQLYANFLTGGGTSYNTITTSFVFSLNTWYHIYYLFQTGGLCALYVNGVMAGSLTNTSGIGTQTTRAFGLGTWEVTDTSVAFNGYIDDFRLYHAAIPIHVLLPQNYRSLALSGTGNYTLASAASGWVVGSSDLLKTWSKQTVNVGTQNDFIQPNMTGLASSGAALSTSWIMNDITWTASASSVFDPAGTTGISNIFNNTSLYEWVALSSTYTTTGNSSGKLTTIDGAIGNVTGEWIQIESSVPLIMSSYQFATGNVTSRTPKTYYIVGNNSGNTWFPIQYGAGAAVTSTAGYTTVPNVIIVNSKSTQTFGSSSIATTTYATTTNAYTRFRLICLSTYSGPNEVVSLGEWFINFIPASRPSTSSLSISYTGQYQLVATGPVAGSVMPNSAVVTSNTWVANGVAWTSSGSSSYVSIPNNYYVLFNTVTTAEWVSSAAVYNTSGNTSGFNTTFYTNGSSTSTIQGDYIQLQSSIPLVMSSYQLANSGEVINFIKSFYIVGSNDSVTWYAIQYGIVAAQPTAVASTLLSNVISVNSASAQTFGTSTMTTTTYTGTTNSYTHFRMIIVSTYNSSAYHARFSEWLINFQNSVSYSSNYGSTWSAMSSVVSESVALSLSGQYALSTNSVPPLARLMLEGNNLDTQGVLTSITGLGTPTYPADVFKVGSNAVKFTQTPGGVPSMYLNYTVPAVLNKPSALTMVCWVYPITLSGNSTPIILNAGPGSGGYANEFYVSSTGQVFVFWSTTVNSTGTLLTTSAYLSLNTWSHLAFTFLSGIITVYVNGLSVATLNAGGLLCAVGGGNMTNLIVGAAGSGGGAWNGYIDDVRIYTSALSNATISTLYNNPTLMSSQIVAVSNSYLPITSYTFPSLSGINANVVDTAVSQTGQYMVAVTSGTTNNVYYSTNFGATFTALTVVSAALTSCAISADGSYMTVTSGTTIHTLNRNARGFTVALGNQAGRINQGLNAIAIGDKAGQTNQSANSIILNASGSILDAIAPGLYVAPVAEMPSSISASVSLLGHGTDGQVVRSGLTVLNGNGNVGIGTTVPVTILDVRTTNLNLTTGVNQNQRMSMMINQGTAGSFNGTFGGYMESGVNYGVSHYLALGTVAWSGTASTFDERFRILGTGNVGIGTTTPAYPLHVVGNINLTGSILYNGVAITTGAGSIWTAGSGGVTYYNGGFVGIGTAAPLARFTIRSGYSDGDTSGLCLDTNDGSVYNMRLSTFVQGSGQVGYRFGVNNQAAAYPNTLVLGYNGNVGIGMTLPAYSLDVAGTIQGQTAFQSSPNVNNAGMGPMQAAYLGQYGAAASRATSVRIGDIVGAAYYMCTGSYNLSFYKDVSGANAVPALQIIGLNATNAIPNVYVQNSLGIGTTPNGVNSLTVYGNGAFIQGTSVGTTTANNVGNFGLRISQVASASNTVGQIVGQMCFHGFGRPYASSFVRSITDAANGYDDASALVFGVSNGGLGAAEAVRISSAGYVGIGIATPVTPLHVGIFKDQMLQSGAASRVEWYCTGYNTYAFTANSTSNCSIRTVASIVIESGFYTAWSDVRIKTNIKKIESALDKINQIDVVSYDMIDVVDGQNVDAGVIAQNVISVLPKAVQTSSGYIPNIHTRGTHVILSNRNIRIYVPCSQKDITDGVKVKMTVIKHVTNEQYQNGKEETYETEIISHTNEYLEVAPWVGYSTDHIVFVYGTYITDLLTVDKNQIAMLAVRGVQELSSLHKQLSSSTSECLQELITLRAENALLKSEMSSLQAANAATSNHMAALLTWAQAQGFSGTF